VAEFRTQAAMSYKPIRAPRGTALSCKGWKQEAILRLLMNSVDAAVAERPEELIVTGGIGKLARDWETFQAIVKLLQELEGNETLIIRSGDPQPIRKTQPDVPRVILVNSIWPPLPQTSPAPASAEREPAMPTPAPRLAADWMFIGPSREVPQACQIFRAAARKHFRGSLAGRLVVAGGMGGMGGAQALAATLNGAAFLGIDADADRIKRRVKTNYCEVMVNNLDEALRILKNALRKRESASVGLVGNAAEIIPELANRGVLPDLLTDQTPADDLFAYIPRGLTMAQAAELRTSDPRAYREKALDSVAAQVRAMLDLKKMGAVVFEFGNGILEQASACGVADAYVIPDFASEYLAPEWARGSGLLTLIPLLGDLDDLARIDTAFSDLFPDSELQKWIAIARKRPSPGLPARCCWIGSQEAMKLGSTINDLVTKGEIKAPVAMGRSICPNRGTIQRSNQPATRGTEIGEILRSPARPQNDKHDSAAPAPALPDSPELAALLQVASGASWLSFQAAAESEESLKQSLSFVIVADGKTETKEAIECLFAMNLAV
jgi:urocanate hydratase